MAVPSLVATFLAILGIVSAFVAIAVFAKAGVAKAKIDVLRAELDDARKTAAALRETRADLELAYSKCKSLSAQMQTEIDFHVKAPQLAFDRIQELIEHDSAEWAEKIDGWAKDVFDVGKSLERLRQSVEDKGSL